MIILGIETSCDETSVALVDNGITILSNVVSSSSELQNKYGGVFPEVAAREQARLMIPVLEETFSKASLTFENIDAIAVTVGPGLIGSLLVGVETAKTLAFVLDKPIIPVNHVLAHLYANWLKPHLQPKFPALCLIVSGGHTDLLLMENHGKIKILGQTLDDAAGEAFDKTARLLGLPYPGGPSIENIAKNGNPKAFNFPRGMIGSKDYNFSFSGLKTAVLREIKKINLPSSTIPNLAASIQEAIVDILVKKTLIAAEEFKPKSILLSGGVAANSRLREKFQLEIRNSSLEIPLFIPSPSLCTDNAAAIAAYAYFNYHHQPWKRIEAQPSLGY
ncbi:MAG: tRNA (adenosine(37)-N6)-threonylcarbamoyltransferase complex transferase subunit TsaD [Patescibacteria group bacterium]|nr:tRNA (adenosine(37)-N6)-threonylcarbamoyltransferase complex transferase subunit TsaD [Patescibacteria group bacterium]